MRKVVLIGLFFLLLVSCGSKKPGLKIACAANMQVCIDSIAQLFEQDYGITCDVVSNSSGMLTAQIKSGAPFDLFLSANMDYPNELYNDGLADKPFLCATGQLILAYKSDKAYQTAEELLKDEAIGKIAIADEKTAPYGMAAIDYLKKAQLYDQLHDRIVVGESIGQVNQYLTTNAVSASITSYSFIVTSGSDYDYFEIPQEKFEPIEHGLVLLKHGKENNLALAESFIDYLAEDKIRAVLNYFGYLVE